MIRPPAAPPLPTICAALPLGFLRVVGAAGPRPPRPGSSKSRQPPPPPRHQTVLLIQFLPGCSGSVGLPLPCTAHLFWRHRVRSHAVIPTPSLCWFPCAILRRSLSRLSSVVCVAFLLHSSALRHCWLEREDSSSSSSFAAVRWLQALDFSDCCHSHGPSFRHRDPRRSGAKKVLGRNH